MQMTDRHLVEGTTPRITIGHRISRRDGKKYVYRTWTAQWSFEGKGYTEALQTTNKTAAIRKAHQIHERIHAGEVAPRKFKIGLVELWDRYIETRRVENLAPGTLELYDLKRRHFIQWVQEQGIRSATSFKEKNYYEYANHLKDKGLAEATTYTHLVSMKQVFKWAHREKLIPENPVGRPKLHKPVFKKQPCFTADQVAQILAVAEPHDACVYATLAYTGMRIGELCALQWSDIDQDRGKTGIIEVRGGGSTVATKNRKVRRIPINSKLLPYLDRHPRTDGLVFTEPPRKRRGGKPPLIDTMTLALPAEDDISGSTGEVPGGIPGAGVSQQRLRQTIKALCKQLGFADWKRCKLHTFRHAFASACAENNVPYRYALEWMGHHSSRILDLYIEIFDGAATEQMQVLDFGGKTTGEGHNGIDSINP